MEIEFAVVEAVTGVSISFIELAIDQSLTVVLSIRWDPASKELLLPVDVPTSTSSPT